MLQCDVLVIGSGGAGLATALLASEKNANVIVVGETYPTRSQTCMAQGGINAALGNISADSPAQHSIDTLKAAAGLASEQMVKRLCKSAPETIFWLDAIGVPFSRTPDNKIAQRRLGGTANTRACYSQDYTGLKILHTLYDQLLAHKIPCLNERFLLELAVDDNTVKGAYFYNIREGKIETILAKSVVLATGGYSGIYHGYTTNTRQSSGDGIAVALQAGAVLSNMEFIQFHPTALKGSGILISESARGAGGTLINQNGERFTDELAPRDQVSRAIWQELSKGNQVYLDIRHLGESFIDEYIPQERKLCLTYAGIDPVHEPIPIAPVAHYSMGGISVDQNHMSTIRGLFAVGECANARVHGANRLGGNSLMEIIAFGRECGITATNYAQQCTIPQSLPDKHVSNHLQQLLDLPHKQNFYDIRTETGTLLYQKAGIIRDKESLSIAKETIESYVAQLPRMGILDHGNIYNTNLIERLKFENSLLLARVILEAALFREESRGAHFRTDFPTQRSEYEKESLTLLEKENINTRFQEVAS